MGYYRRFAALFALSCFAYTSLIFVSAAELPMGISVEDDSNVYYIAADTIVIQSVVGDVDDPEVSVEAPLALEEDELRYPAISAYALDSGAFPFYGSCWVQGNASGLGDVTLFFPINYKEGYIGTDNSGRLFNVSNNSWSGVLYDSGGSSYTVNFGSFGLPTYRRYTGSSYTNVTLYLTPEDGNILFPDSPSPVYSLTDLLPYISILLLGGVFICSMRRS